MQIKYLEIILCINPEEKFLNQIIEDIEIIKNK